MSKSKSQCWFLGMCCYRRNCFFLHYCILMLLGLCVARAGATYSPVSIVGPCFDCCEAPSVFLVRGATQMAKFCYSRDTNTTDTTRSSCGTRRRCPLLRFWTSPLTWAPSGSREG